MPRLLVLLISLALLALARPAEACAPAWPEGAFVDIVGEEALIVYDEAKRREHFIRRASFHSDTKDFGFLVPTPSPPELAEVDDAIFDDLQRAIAPEIQKRDRTVYHWTLCSGLVLGPMRGAEDKAAPPVDVLARQRVAGLDAAVLASEDAEALGAWLKDNGYPFRPELAAWVKPYLDERWVITAFKFAHENTGPQGSKAVRMSFAADAPFYPYREPTDQKTRLAGYYAEASAGMPDRSLRLYLVTSSRYTGALDDGSAWPAKLTHAAPPRDRGFAKHLPAGMVPEGAWLHAFVDASSPRDGRADLRFDEADDQAEVRPAAIVHWRDDPLLIPLDLILFALIGGSIGWRRGKAMKRAKSDEPAP